MSLNKQMMIFIASMLLILLIGTFALNLSNTKNFLQDQLSSHAQDTATSLGLSLSSNADPDDLPTMETMINAVFDRGYYSNITLTDMDGKILYERTNPKEMEAVPSWFIHSIDLQTPPAAAVVQSGWIPTGTLEVTSHTGYAYIELWKAFINLSTWFLLAAAAAILIVVTALRIMLKPLKQMEKQAEAIVKKEYLVQDHLPNTVEFRRVVSAMNAMVQKMKEVFERDAKTAERLQKMAYQDNVTGLSNRRHFEMIVDSLLDPKEDASPGIIALIRIHGLKELNDQFGYLIGDQLVKNIADKMQEGITSPDALSARLNGTELVAVIPSESQNKIQPGLQAINDAIPDLLSELNASHAPVSVSVAFMDYQPGDSRGKLLSSLDYAIQQASEQGENNAFYYSDQAQTDNQNSIWTNLIEKAIQEARFILYQQSAYTLDGKIDDKEVLIRLKDEEGTVHSAGYFMPAVEQLGKTTEIDKLVVGLVFDYLATHSSTHRLSVNLTRSIILNRDLQSWLLDKLQHSGSYCKNLSFELTEQLISESPETTFDFIRSLKALGVAIGIDHFGSRFANLRYLQGLQPDYVKLDSAFSKAIESDDQTRSYVSSLCEMAKSLDIKVIAMAIENQAQLDAFKELGVPLFQGYYYGAPTPLAE
ncbi:EAL domain-containing protein [Thiomicrorhabdus sp. ZW0627]|uniref:bifunctional diguanylate cyclase/phosphodiesterase n=1 Tax=Thiomicrorhabdus sp. ZW0627 TaxID=3039774 RepID=UPI00243731F8|nr:EAL domain-containing protein [Thiomicrorhabdus sp. ZW0627]MDG6774469.1 EAL domain-containing protein [Thiomicrorhabdus sp. ZW0627]